jgi:ArsR family transcriptional regulator
LTPEEHRRNKLVIIGFHYATLPAQSWPSFPAYIDHLAAMEPRALRDKMLSMYARKTPCAAGNEGPTWFDEPTPLDLDAILQDVDSYLGFLNERFGPEYVDVELETEAYPYVVDPPAMQEAIVTHLRSMWDEHLAVEWARTEPMLQDAVQAFQQVDLGNLTKRQAVELVSGQELEEEKWACVLDSAERMVFVPSAHVGPYLGKLYAGDATLWVFFGARLPEGVEYHAPDLNRAEILVRLSALSDENRLRILRLVSENGEQRSQEIIAALDLSQSTVSRHLKQLCATGYLSERRCDGGKCYKFRPQRIKDTLQAISSFLLVPHQV